MTTFWYVHPWTIEKIFPVVPREDVDEIPTITIGYYEGNGEHYKNISKDADFAVGDKRIAV